VGNHDLGAVGELPADSDDQVSDDHRARTPDPRDPIARLVRGKLVGIAIHTGSRIEALAAPSEILVSSLVKELVAGAGITFEDRGEHELKGIPGAWRLFAATL
jgi:hypothetical protein